MEGNELKRLRERAGLTQQQLSQKTGVSRSLISQWENGVISVSAATKKRIADFFGVDSTPAKRVPEKKQEQPRITMSEAARQELGELTKQYQTLNHNLEQMLGRLTESELTGLKESAAALMQAIDTETIFRQVKCFQQHKTATSREALTQALARLLEDDTTQ
ncbi:MAG: helix-turn-helix domain-containing protein [Butyricicoccus pullicaecorum]|nr:helix-turn-helix domain-containing protein [Butyricicoccus pullicaecorum]